MRTIGMGKIIVAVLFLLGFIGLAAIDVVRDKVKVHLERVFSRLAEHLNAVWIRNRTKLLAHAVAPPFRILLFLVSISLLIYGDRKAAEILAELNKTGCCLEKSPGARLVLGQQRLGARNCMPASGVNRLVGEVCALSSSYLVVLPGNGSSEVFRGARWKFDGWAGPKGKNIINGLVVSSEATGEVLLDVATAQTGKAISFTSGRCQVQVELALNESLARAGFVLVRYTVASIRDESNAPDCVFPPVA